MRTAAAAAPSRAAGGPTARVATGGIPPAVDPRWRRPRPLRRGGGGGVAGPAAARAADERAGGSARRRAPTAGVRAARIAGGFGAGRAVAGRRADDLGAVRPRARACAPAPFGLVVCACVRARAPSDVRRWRVLRDADSVGVRLGRRPPQARGGGDGPLSPARGAARGVVLDSAPNAFGGAMLMSVLRPRRARQSARRGAAGVGGAGDPPAGADAAPPGTIVPYTIRALPVSTAPLRAPAPAAAAAGRGRGAPPTPLAQAPAPSPWVLEPPVADPPPVEYVVPAPAAGLGEECASWVRE